LAKANGNLFMPTTFGLVFVQSHSEVNHGVAKVKQASVKVNEASVKVKRPSAKVKQPPAKLQ
jgi:hypothetical protein